MSEKSRVFISYSRADTRVTTALAKDLHAAGIDIWMDKDDISVGERWSTAIQSALEGAHAMVLILSPDSMASRNVEDEFTYFMDNNKPIVPVMVRPCKLHFQLHRLQWIDFTEGNHDTTYAQLIRALHRVGIEFDESRAESRQSVIVSQLLSEIDAEQRQSKRRRTIMGGLAAILIIGILIIVGLLVLSDGGSGDVVTPVREFVTGRVIVPDAVMYEQPSRDSLVISEDIPQESAVIVRQYTPDERFLLVDFGRVRGFVLRGDIEVENLKEIAIYISPTPLPTATATQFITPTPTVTPSPTPEAVLNPAGT